jgi:hypothetical protein
LKRVAELERGHFYSCVAGLSLIGSPWERCSVFICMLVKLFRHNTAGVKVPSSSLNKLGVRDVVKYAILRYHLFGFFCFMFECMHGYFYGLPWTYTGQTVSLMYFLTSMWMRDVISVITLTFIHTCCIPGNFYTPPSFYLILKLSSLVKSKFKFKLKI